MDLTEIRKLAFPVCAELQVKRLDVFGSVARGQDKSASDVDFLVEFEDPENKPSKRFFKLLHYLEDHLERGVDLLTTTSLKNPYLRRRILAERVNVYGR